MNGFLFLFDPSALKRSRSCVGKKVAEKLASMVERIEKWGKEEGLEFPANGVCGVWTKV